MKRDALEQKKQFAINAYKEGFIRLGKLAEVLGLDPVSTRVYLKEHGISVRSQELKEIAQDAANA